MLLDREWKAALNADGQVYLLFDVINDPQEQNNLAGKKEMREIEKNLRLRLLERLMQSQLRGSGYHAELHGPVDLRQKKR